MTYHTYNLEELKVVMEALPKAPKEYIVLVPRGWMKQNMAIEAKCIIDWVNKPTNNAKFNFKISSLDGLEIRETDWVRKIEIIPKWDTDNWSMGWLGKGI